MVLIPHLRPSGSVASVFSAYWEVTPARPEVLIPHLRPSGSVASFFSAPGSGSPSRLEVALAGLCPVVASIFSAPGSGSDAYALSLGLKSLLYTRMATIRLDIFIRLTLDDLFFYYFDS